MNFPLWNRAMLKHLEEIRERGDDAFQHILQEQQDFVPPQSNWTPPDTDHSTSHFWNSILLQAGLFLYWCAQRSDAGLYHYFTSE